MTMLTSTSLFEPPNFPETGEFIYVVSAYQVQEPRKKFSKRVIPMIIGYFDSFEKAEAYLLDYCVLKKRGEELDKVLHHLRIEKMSLNTELETGLGYWIYHKEGSLFQSYHDTELPF